MRAHAPPQEKTLPNQGQQTSKGARLMSSDSTPSRSAAGAGLLTRRDLLRVGPLAIAGTLLPVAPGQAAPARGSARSVIVLWMAGGVTHIDSFDPKPDAPTEVRGTLGAIATTLPGVRFCETLPCLARQAHRLAVIRSFSH